MLFNSFHFLVFYIIVTSLYFILPHKYRWVLLLIASCIFYMAFIPAYILILLLTIVIDYCAGIFIENAINPKRKLYLVISIITNVGVLSVFKYYNFFIQNVNAIFESCGFQIYDLPYWKIILPIGLSFHTFQAMSYTIEVYRGNQKAEKHFFIYALYVMFYPQLVAGPIERPQNLLHQFKEEHKFSYTNLLNGLRLMLWGLFKKVVIADRLSIYADAIFTHHQNYHTAQLVIGVLCFTIQIYCDFSGYSDIAIGCAQTMGFNLMTNFNRPYLSKNIQEFWAKWHISLSSWFRDYVYISLGGNKVVQWKIYRNVAIVFLLSGFWHGANWTFIVWGAIHAFFTITYLIVKVRLPLIARWLQSGLTGWFLTFVVVAMTWIFFRAANVQQATSILCRIITFDNSVQTFQAVRNFGLLSGLVGILTTIYMLLIEAFTTPHLKFFEDNYLYDVLFFTFNLSLVIAFGVFQQATFIYFQF